MKHIDDTLGDDMVKCYKPETELIENIQRLLKERDAWNKYATVMEEIIKNQALPTLGGRISILLNDSLTDGFVAGYISSLRKECGVGNE